MTDNDHAGWHDLVQPAPPPASPSTPSAPTTEFPVPTAPAPCNRCQRPEDPYLTRRRLTAHTVGDGILAGFYAALGTMFGWAATIVAPHTSGPILLAAAIMIASATLGTITLTLAAVTAVHAQHDRRTRTTMAVATWLTRLHLAAATAVPPLAAIRYPYVISTALVPLIMAATTWIFLLNTRDTVNHYARHREPPTAGTR